MEANIFYWGPLVLRTVVNENDLNEINKLCERKINFNHELAGHLNDQFRINYYELENILKKHLELYKQHYQHYYNNVVDFYVSSAWVNFMKKGDFNPPHEHGGDFSAVLFLSVPEELKKENENFKGVGRGPGELRFYTSVSNEDFITQISIFPKRGELYIFPAKLPHLVAPFKSDVERISVAFNMNRKKTK